MKESIKKCDFLNEIRHQYLSEQPYNENDTDEDDLDPNDESDVRNYLPSRSHYKDRVHDSDEGSVNYTGEKHRGLPIIKLRIPKVIDSDDLIPQGKNGTFAKSVMKTKNPLTGQWEEGYAVTDIIIETPNGSQLYLIKNYGVPQNNEGFSFNYIDVKGGRRLYAGLPIRGEYGIEKPDKYLEAVKAPKSPSEKQKYSKRLISSRINLFFNSNDIQEKLKSMLMSPVVGDYRYTEMRTNVIRKMSWGVDTPELNFAYNGVVHAEELRPALEYLMEKLSEKNVDIDLIPEIDDEFINDVFDINVEPESNDINLDTNTNYIAPKVGNRNDIVVGQHKRRGSSSGKADYMTRYQAGHIYKGGKWKLSQRVGSKDEFKKAGGYTKVRKLYSKDIQLGEMSVASMSELKIFGNISNGQYIMKVIFEPYLSIRPLGKDTGVDIGNTIKPIEFVITRDLPDGLTEETFDLGDSTNDKTVLFMTGNDGVLTEALGKLKIEIINLDQEDVINNIINIFMKQMNDVNESTGAKIVITDSQAKRILRKINEERFDDMINNFNKSKNEEIPVPEEDLIIMLNIVKDWCNKRQDDSDCERILGLKDRLNIV